MTGPRCPTCNRVTIRAENWCIVHENWCIVHGAQRDVLDTRQYDAHTPEKRTGHVLVGGFEWMHTVGYGPLDGEHASYGAQEGK